MSFPFPQKFAFTRVFLLFFFFFLFSLHTPLASCICPSFLLSSLLHYGNSRSLYSSHSSLSLSLSLHAASLDPFSPLLLSSSSSSNGAGNLVLEINRSLDPLKYLFTFLSRFRSCPNSLCVGERERERERIARSHFFMRVLRIDCSIISLRHSNCATLPSLLSLCGTLCLFRSSFLWLIYFPLSLSLPLSLTGSLSLSFTLFSSLSLFICILFHSSRPTLCYAQ